MPYQVKPSYATSVKTQKENLNVHPPAGHSEGNSLIFELFGHKFPVLDLPKLIIAKRTAGRAKDLISIPELEATQQRQI